MHFKNISRLRDETPLSHKPKQGANFDWGQQSGADSLGFAWGCDESNAWGRKIYDVCLGI